MLLLTSVHSMGMWMMSAVIRLLQIYSYVFLADAVSSWFLRPGSRIRQILVFLTEPLVSLFRPLEERIRRNSMFPISLAHLFAYIFLQILQSVLYRVMVFVV